MNSVGSHLLEVSGVVRFTGAEGRRVAARGCGSGELLANGDGAQARKMETFWRWMVRSGARRESTLATQLYT